MMMKVNVNLHGIPAEIHSSSDEEAGLVGPDAEKGRICRSATFYIRDNFLEVV